MNYVIYVQKSYHTPYTLYELYTIGINNDNLVVYGVEGYIGSMISKSSRFYNLDYYCGTTGTSHDHPTPIHDLFLVRLKILKKVKVFVSSWCLFFYNIVFSCLTSLVYRFPRVLTNCSGR